jgi:FkbM family methyltransferase
MVILISYRTLYAWVNIGCMYCWYCKGQQDHNLLKRLKLSYPDFEPEVVLDIGANRGMYAETLRKVYPTTKILMFEASSEHDATLQDFVTKDGNSEQYIGVLSGVDGDKVNFFNNGGSTGNSMFRENTVHFANLAAVEKITSKIDTIVASSPLANGYIVDFIKADVQGAELLVFQGATKALEQATFVQFEGSTIEYNEGGACFYEIDELLRSYGFYLYEVGDFLFNPVFKTKGMGQFDALYVKPSSSKAPVDMKENKPKFCGVGRASKSLLVTGQRRLVSDKIGPISGGFHGVLNFLLGVILTSFVVIWRERRGGILHQD